jgi:hypothetical protein
VAGGNGHGSDDEDAGAPLAFGNCLSYTATLFDFRDVELPCADVRIRYLSERRPDQRCDNTRDRRRTTRAPLSLHDVRSVGQLRPARLYGFEHGAARAPKCRRKLRVQVALDGSSD